MSLFDPLPRPYRLSDADAAGDWFAPLAAEAVEVVALVYLGGDQRVLGMRQFRSNAGDWADLPIRAIAADALAFDAAGVVMAHNHPGGDPTPSTADRDATQRLARALRGLDVRLIDHLVVARSGIRSFRALGLL